VDGALKITRARQKQKSQFTLNDIDTEVNDLIESFGKLIFLLSKGVRQSGTFPELMRSHLYQVRAS
jgi:hypothetical protein